MKNLFSVFILSFIVLLVVSCAKIYTHPDTVSRAKRHKIVALIPPSVSIPANKKIDAEAMKEQQKTESTNFQNEIYAWLLKRKSQNKFSPEILDLVTTNAKLKKLGYPENPLTTEELCNELGVDALINSNFKLSKPMSEGAAIALGVVFGVWGNTNEVVINMSINDCDTQNLLWNYEHKASGSVFNSASGLVDNLMRSASKKMPYNKK